jgi:hypothetical protein
LLIDDTDGDRDLLFSLKNGNNDLVNEFNVVSVRGLDYVTLHQFRKLLEFIIPSKDEISDRVDEQVHSHVVQTSSHQWTTFFLLPEEAVDFEGKGRLVVSSEERLPGAVKKDLGIGVELRDILV